MVMSPLPLRQGARIGPAREKSACNSASVVQKH